MKKKLFIVLLGVSVLLNVAFIGIKLFSNNDIDDGFNEPSQVKHEHMLSMMLEQNAGAGDYSLETRSSWPTKEDGYVFNSTLSKCEKGSKLRWDEENNAVVMVGTTSDKCYVYFDKILLLTEYIIAQYTGTQGENNLYYHNGTILDNDGTVLDAGDNSYRYAGSSETTNNFVCFGSEDITCPDDNLYRIIGVFENQIKLIKWDYATSELLGTDGDSNGACSANSNCVYGINNGYYKGSNMANNIGAYFWNYANQSATYSSTNYYNVWSYSKLNTVNLNTNFLNNIGTEWANKIAETTWKVGGNNWNNIVVTKAVDAYMNEFKNPNITMEVAYNAKVALMYTSDYGFATTSSSWVTTLDSYRNINNDNWMYMGLYEWTILRRSDDFNYVFRIHYLGEVGNAYANINNNAFAVRPVFYLNSDVTYKSGDGTKTSPIRIN